MRVGIRGVAGIIIGCLGAIALGLAFAGYFSGDAFTSADSWYDPPPVDQSDAFLDGVIEPARFAPVVDALQAEAQADLADVPVQRIDADEAARLAGHPLPVGGEYVLLRGVVLLEETGAFMVRLSGHDVKVHHGCLGHRPAPMRRKAIVAVLPTVPERVYVSCSMAE